MEVIAAVVNSASSWLIMKTSRRVNVWSHCECALLLSTGANATLTSWCLAETMWVGTRSYIVNEGDLVKLHC